MVVVDIINCEEEILNVLKKKSLIVDICNSSSLKEDLKIDPMDYFDIILEIEHMFSIELNDDDIYEIITVNDLVECVRKKIK